MKYIIYGFGISGISTAKFLTANGHDAICTDDNLDSLAKNSQKFPEFKFRKFDDINFDDKSIISFAPGIPLYFPKPHKILEIVKKTKADLCCDMEIFYRKNSQKKFIGITGTNGKSTTTSLLGFILNELKIPSAIGGNIGVPCFDLEQNIDDFTYIFESSSYQLDLLSKTHFQIASLLNITPDHIDRHGSMENYIISKKRIFNNQNENDFSVIGVDNQNSKEVFLELQNDDNFKANLVPISTKKIQENGVSLFDNKLTCNIDGNFEINLTSEFLLGEHNDQNMAFAFAISYIYLKKLTNIKIDPEKIIAAIKKFTGLRHRMQVLGKIDNIRFINDSKATNSESCSNALKTYNNIFWIVGGKAKESGISDLKPFFNKITKAYLIGESSAEFAKILQENSVNFEKCENIQNAFKKSVNDAKNSSLTEKNILLSPACASFDQWKNFEQRGDYFCKLFDELSGLKVT